jgi:stress response protein YsnF
MTLRTLESAYPNYRHTFEGNDIKGLDLYTEGGERVGSVEDVLVDDKGRFRYLVIHPSAWRQGKSVLLPIGLSRIDYEVRRVYVDGLRNQQVEQLPEYQANVPIDRTYETRVRNVYREQPLEASAPLESSMPLEGAAETTGTAMPARTTEPVGTPQVSGGAMGTTEAIGTTGVTETAETRPTVGVTETTETRTTVSSEAYPYDRDPDMYEVTDRNHQLLKQHQDQLRNYRR